MFGLSMNTGTTMGSAVLRSVYLALGSFAVAFLPAWAVTDELKGPIISGGLAALWALGFRGAVEGGFDTSRDAEIAAGNRAPRPADVGQPNA